MLIHPQTGVGSSHFLYLLSAVSLILTSVSFSAPTEPPNCDSLVGFPRTNRSSSPSSYSVSSTSDRIQGFSASPGAQRHTATTGRVRKCEAALRMNYIQQSFPMLFFFSFVDILALLLRLATFWMAFFFQGKKRVEEICKHLQCQREPAGFSSTANKTKK